jgi:hypothetical protein
MFRVKRAFLLILRGCPFFLLNLYLHNLLSSDLKPQKSPLRDPFLVVIIRNNGQGGNKLARSNYNFKKRQKELARKKKKENPNQSQNEGENL